MWNRHNILGLLLLSTLLLLQAEATDVPEHEPQVLSLINQQNLDGAAHFRHETVVDNGIHQKAEGDVNGVAGEYFLPGEEGHPPVRVTYTAGPNGFQPQVHPE